MSYLQQTKSSGFGRVVKLALGATVLAAGTLIGVYGHFSKSDNLKKHLRTVDPYCLAVRYYTTAQFLKENKDVIARAVERYKKYGVTAEDIAAVLIDHNPRPKYEDLKDYFGSQLAKVWIPNLTPWTKHVYNGLGDPTTGAGQIKLSTAMRLDMKFNGISQGRIETLDALNDPQKNVNYIAMTIADLKSRRNRKSNAKDPLDDAHRSAVTTTEYRRGESKNTIERAKPSIDTTKNSWLPLVGLNLTDLIGLPFRMTKEQRESMLRYIEEQGIPTERFRNEAWRSERQELIRCLD